MNTTKVQLGTSINFIGVINKNVYGRLFRGTGMTQNSIKKVSSFWTTAHENKTFSIQHHFQVQEYPFQIAQVVWAYSRHLGWLLLLSGSLSKNLLKRWLFSECLSAVLTTYSCWRRTYWMVIFKVFLKLFWVHVPNLMSFPAIGNVSLPFKTFLS